MTNRAVVVVVSLLAAAVPLSTAHATWQPDGNLVCGATSNQRSTVAISDGAGGAFIAWTDLRNDAGDIFMQRVDGDGNQLWTPGGIAVCSATAAQDWPSLLSDGVGGAIVAWSDGRNDVGDIYAQRVNGSGIAQWTANGVAVCTAARAQGAPRMTSNGAGGAILVWDDDRAGNGDVYAARLTAAGATPDGAGGIPISTGVAPQGGPSLTPYGGGGAIIAWTDGRNGSPDIYAARLSNSGVVLDPSGIAICTAANDQRAPATIGDGAGGAIIAWSDSRSETIYAQHINASGAVQWLANGLPVGGGGSGSIFDLPKILADGAGGAIVSWWDWDGSDYNIYAQRINASGARQWLPDDVKVCGDPSDQRSPVMTSDNAGGVLIAWQDARAGGPGNDIYAQRVSPSGSVAWTANGVPVCQAELDQSDLAAVSDGAGGAIIAWSDPRSFLDSDIYAQHIGPGGLPLTSVGATPGAAFRVLPASPNPFTSRTTLEVRSSKPSNLSVDLFNVAGRRVRGIAFASRQAGVRQVVVDGRDDAGHPLPSGVYFCRVRTGGSVLTQRLVLLR